MRVVVGARVPNPRVAVEEEIGRESDDAHVVEIVKDATEQDVSTSSSPHQYYNVSETVISKNIPFVRRNCHSAQKISLLNIRIIH